MSLLTLPAEVLLDIYRETFSNLLHEVKDERFGISKTPGIHRGEIAHLLEQCSGILLACKTTHVGFTAVIPSRLALLWRVGPNEAFSLENRNPLPSIVRTRIKELCVCLWKDYSHMGHYYNDFSDFIIDRLPSLEVLEVLPTPCVRSTQQQARSHECYHPCAECHKCNKRMGRFLPDIRKLLGSPKPPSSQLRIYPAVDINTIRHWYRGSQTGYFENTLLPNLMQHYPNLQIRVRWLLGSFDLGKEHHYASQIEVVETPIPQSPSEKPADRVLRCNKAEFAVKDTSEQLPPKFTQIAGWLINTPLTEDITNARAYGAIAWKYFIASWSSQYTGLIIQPEGMCLKVMVGECHLEGEGIRRITRTEAEQCDCTNCREEAAGRY